MKICNFCGNSSFVEKRVQYIYKHDDRFLIVNGVPCQECTFCGEQYFEAVVLKKIEKDFRDIYFYGKVVEQEIKVPVEEFAET
ncbi:MAG: YgiT-type zinc finger protein [Nitrospirae bacterium]|uniref:YgiT-type zinc finger protein n=1 Tax=Candidatus Magnetobacterium casense TaxID=1455061 RepID=UPI00058BCF82|nr:YgiT-type zinc finger protein [Candidatus Magnetobacterium casensis]MBF0337312.1 YgiT-type zinc finger protein [Nitrospirota bacterium]